MNPPVITPKLVYAVTAVILAAIGYATWQTLASAGDGVLALTVAPPDAVVTIDGHTKTKPGDISLTPGTHELTISHKDFDSKTVMVTIAGGQKQSQGVTLDAAAGATPAAPSTSAQQQSGEAAAGSIATKEGAKITANNPLIKLLPYYGDDFNIDYGASQLHPGNPDYVGIYITAPGSAAKTHALNWIKSQGFDPAAYEIIYQTPSE